MFVRSCALALVLSSSALAADPDLPLAPLNGTAAGLPGHWSVATGETVSPGRDAVAFELGWPGVTFAYLHGLTDRADAGVKIGLLYGFEDTSDSKFGFGLSVPLRLVVNRKDKFQIGLHAEPGLRTWAGDRLTGHTDFFLAFPVGATLGIQATPELRLAGIVDLNMALQIPTTTYLEVGPSFGFGVEYLVDKSLQVGIKMMFGPQFYTVSGADAQFAFSTNIVVGYRL